MVKVKEGEPAPDFRLPSSEGGELSLRSLLGQWVVLYFYPRDNTPGCTREACAFGDSLAKLKRRGAVVLGVSPDSLQAHARFKEQHGLRFPLLSDADKAVAKAFGAFGDKVMYGKKVTGIIRSTFLIDPAGVVRKVYVKVSPSTHSDDVLADLAALQASK